MSDKKLVLVLMLSSFLLCNNSPLSAMIDDENKNNNIFSAKMQKEEKGNNESHSFPPICLSAVYESKGGISGIGKVEVEMIDCKGRKTQFSSMFPGPNRNISLANKLVVQKEDLPLKFTYSLTSGYINVSEFLSKDSTSSRMYWWNVQNKQLGEVTKNDLYDEKGSPLVAIYLQINEDNYRIQLNYQKPQ